MVFGPRGGAWGRGADVVTVTSRDISDGEIDGEWVCIPYSGYPVEIENGLMTFFVGGGGLLHFGGLPFVRPLQREGSDWRDCMRTLGDIR